MPIERATSTRITGEQQANVHVTTIELKTKLQKTKTKPANKQVISKSELKKLKVNICEKFESIKITVWIYKAST